MREEQNFNYLTVEEHQQLLASRNSIKSRSVKKEKYINLSRDLLVDILKNIY